MKITRYNNYENRGFDAEIDPSTIESVTEVDGRSVRCIIRTKSGDEISCCDGYAYTVERWQKLCR